MSLIVTDIKSTVKDAFKQSPIHGLRDLDIEQDGESILISGKVGSFYQKQLAQEVVRHISPLVQIVNSVEVELPIND